MCYNILNTHALSEFRPTLNPNQSYFCPMVAPIAYAAVAGSIALYGAYRKGKSSGKSEGIEKGKEEKEKEMTQEAREEVKKELKEEEISKELKEEIKEKYRLEEKAKEEVDVEQSWEAHKEAMKRDPPVEIGDEVELGVEDLEHHHSGKITAVCRKGGFYIFVNNVPEDIQEGDVIRGSITSFGRDGNTAQATFKRR